MIKQSLSRQITIQVLVLSILICMGAYFFTRAYPALPKDPLITSGDSITSILLKKESNLFANFHGTSILLTSSGRVFSCDCNSTNSFKYHGKLSKYDFEKIVLLMQGHDIRLKTYQDLMSDQSIISLILYFKSKRVVSTSLYGESRNENFMRVYKAIEELTDPLLLNIIEMNELDSLDLKTACSTECGEEI